jgi:CHAD domain-containing protein
MVRKTSSGGRVADLRKEVERRLDETLVELERVVSHARPAASALHRLHRDLRRVRVGLGVWRRVATRSVRDDLKTYDRRLKHLARLVGAVRDRDVAIDVLGKLPRPPNPKERVRFHRLRSRLTDDARTGREVLRMFLAAERDAGLFEAIRAGIHAPASRRALGDLRSYLDEVRERGVDAIQVAHRKARRRPTSRRLHRLRLRVRAWRHLNDLASTINRARPAPAHRPLRSLQQRLGRLHDLDVVADFAGPAGIAEWTDELRRARRHLRRRLVRQLRRNRPAELVPSASAVK